MPSARKTVRSLFSTDDGIISKSKRDKKDSLRNEGEAPDEVSV
jgi:hypothetical protein